MEVTTNTASNFILESNVDSLARELTGLSMKQLRERIGENTVDLTNYNKHNGGNGTRVTGKALLLNKIPNLSVIDVDINKDLDELDKERIRKAIFKKLDISDVVVKTGSGGLHIYGNSDLFYVTSNRMIIMTYFNNKDISTFNIRDILMTEAKQDLIDASRSPIDQLICDNYNKLVKGIPCSDALNIKPSDMKDKTFQLQIKDKRDRKRITVNKERVWHYILKDDYKNLYKQTEEDDEF